MLMQFELSCIVPKVNCNFKKKQQRVIDRSSFQHGPCFNDLYIHVPAVNMRSYVYYISHMSSLNQSTPSDSLLLHCHRLRSSVRSER